MYNIAESSYFDVLEFLAMRLDPEGKYWFFSAIADQLRYPSSHTVYFKEVLIHLFGHCNDAAVQVSYFIRYLPNIYLSSVSRLS